MCMHAVYSVISWLLCNHTIFPFMIFSSPWGLRLRGRWVCLGKCSVAVVVVIVLQSLSNGATVAKHDEWITSFESNEFSFAILTISDCNAACGAFWCRTGSQAPLKAEWVECTCSFVCYLMYYLGLFKPHLISITITSKLPTSCVWSTPCRV
jgi:hypothetical protein